MSNQNSQLKRQSSFTPINLIHKNIDKASVPKAIFLQTQQNESFSVENIQNKRAQQNVFNSRKFSKSIHQQKPLEVLQRSIKHSEYNPKDLNQNEIKLMKKISVLELSLNEYKLQTLSLYSKLTERQRLYKQSKQSLQEQIYSYKNNVQSLERELAGQNKLIQEYLEKYDAEVKQKEKCMKIINQQYALIQQLNSQINILERTSTSAREVSVNCIKENQDLKAQIFIEKQKYQILLKDYENLSLNYSKSIRQVSDQNKVLKTKIQQLDMELKIYQKDKQIQELLVLQETIEKRQRQFFKSNQYIQSPMDSFKQYIPRKLKFQIEDKISDKKYNQKQNMTERQNQLKQVINLQKKKIQNLQKQQKATEKRNKELQQLVVKLMK